MQGTWKSKKGQSFDFQGAAKVKGELNFFPFPNLYM